MANKNSEILSAVKSAGEAALRLHEDNKSMRERLRSTQNPGLAVRQQAADALERLTAENAALRAERALIIQRAENAEAALVETASDLDAVCCGHDAAHAACVEYDARLAEAEALLREYAQDALDDLNNWSGYATDYFQQKHDLAGDQAKWQARIDAHLARQP